MRLCKDRAIAILELTELTAFLILCINILNIHSRIYCYYTGSGDLHLCKLKE